MQNAKVLIANHRSLVPSTIAVAVYCAVVRHFKRRSRRLGQRLDCLTTRLSAFTAG
jgi:hypothetical protein